jgi:hypothetical protein
MTIPDRYQLPAFAYEVAAGDVVDGRNVTDVDDPDRPTETIKPFGPGEVTYTFESGDPMTVERMSEVSVSRDAQIVLERLRRPGDEDVT